MLALLFFFLTAAPEKFFRNCSPAFPNHVSGVQRCRGEKPPSVENSD